MPAAAVIPSPGAYIKVDAVKKLVVGGLGGGAVRPSGCGVALSTFWGAGVWGIHLSYIPTPGLL